MENCALSAIRAFMLLRIGLLFLITNLAFANTISAKIDTAVYAKRIITAVNKYRNSKGLNSLQEFTVMDNQAKMHSSNMAGHRISFGHGGFNTRLKNIYANIDKPLGASENVAYFPPNKSPEAVVAMWLTSRGHRHNIEGDYNLTGVGVVVDERGWVYYTQEFARAGNL